MVKSVLTSFCDRLRKNTSKSSCSYGISFKRQFYRGSMTGPLDQFALVVAGRSANINARTVRSRR